MDIGAALVAAGRALRRNPAGVLPFYLAGFAVGFLWQVVVFSGVGLAYALLAVQGRVARFFAAIREIDFASTDPAVDDRLVEAVAILVTPGTVLIVVASVFVAVVVVVVARALMRAAKLHAVAGALTGTSPLVVGLTGVRRDGWRFVRLTALALVLYGVPVLAGGMVVATAAVVSDTAAALAAVSAMMVLGPFLFAVYLLLLFVPQAIVVDDVGVIGGVRRNLRFLRSNPVTVVGFLAVQLGLVVLVAAFTVGFATLSVSRVSSAVILLGVAPFLGLLKTALYLDEERVVESRPLGSASTAVRGAVRRGVSELGSAATGYPWLVAVSGAVFGVGVAAGWRFATPFDLPPETGPFDPREALGLVPFDEFVQIAFNNWLVATASVFAGLAAGVPTVTNLVSNGFILGAAAGIDDLRMFLALVVPHGVIELPALFLAGAVGLALGRDTWRYARGRIDAEALADSIERAFYVLLGLFPVFVLAAFVEAFVTPWVGAVVAG